MRWPWQRGNRHDWDLLPHDWQEPSNHLWICRACGAEHMETDRDGGPPPPVWGCTMALPLPATPPALNTSTLPVVPLDRLERLEAENRALRELCGQAAGWFERITSADDSGHKDLARLVREKLERIG